MIVHEQFGSNQISNLINYVWWPSWFPNSDKNLFCTGLFKWSLLNTKWAIF